ncbi:MAG: hypothetical protein M3N17_02380 [Actinomycetota bacterium]|nr:hypothetical protein [Actinomycetota bacterium]
MFGVMNRNMILAGLVALLLVVMGVAAIAGAGEGPLVAIGVVGIIGLAMLARMTGA